jgi:hypothetical protein
MDGSDERGCACTCTDQFSCQTVCQCLNVSRVCDGIPDCIDQTDERNCTCTTNEYTCLGGGCINRTQLCDGMVNCAKGDDESYPDCACKFLSTKLNIISHLSSSTNNNTSIHYYNNWTNNCIYCRNNCLNTGKSFSSVNGNFDENFLGYDTSYHLSWYYNDTFVLHL